MKAGRYKLIVPEVRTSRGNQDFRDVWASRLWGLARETSLAKYLSHNITASKEWDDTMARKTYRIELKIDFADDERHAILLDLAKQYARDFLASAMLLQDGRRPACVLHTDDTFIGMEEIDILTESDNIHVPDQP